MYSAHGQRIIAVKDGGKVMFYDHDRSIRGVYKDVSDLPLTQKMVRHHYDYNLYDHLSWSDRPDVFDSGWEEELSLVQK
jgi:hypothetical protein